MVRHAGVLPGRALNRMFAGIFTGVFSGARGGWQKWREASGRIARERAEKRVLQKAMAARAAVAAPQPLPAESAYAPIQPSINDPQRPPFVPQVLDREEEHEPEHEEIPIRTLEELPPEPPPFELTQPAPVDISRRSTPKPAQSEPRKARSAFKLPPTNLLQEPPERTAFDSLELKETAASIKSKFEEFNVRGNGDADQSGSGGDHVRVQAGSRREVFAHHYADRRSVPGLAGGIDSDRAHSRQTDRRHRSAELQARSHQPAADFGIGRISQFGLAA